MLVRTDLNVPIENGVVTDASRIESHVQTLRELAGRGGRVIVLSHLGRPKGKVVPSLSLKPVAAALAKSLGQRVRFAEDCVGPKAKSAVDKMRDGDVLLLENTRFHTGEEQGNEAFAKEVAQLGDLFVNDAFSVAHRDHATTTTLAYELPSAAGRAMQSELSHLHATLDDPERPLMAVVGGAKVSGKIGILENLVKRVETLAIGGAMANTLLSAQGREIGRSLCERDMAGTARQLLALAGEQNCRVILPEDAVVASELAPGVATREVAIDIVPQDTMILDIGTRTVASIGAALDEARTLVWNGPLGAFEIAPFDRGTVALAKRVAELTQAGKLLSVAGGGDTVAALAAAGVIGELSYVSTAGGAFLEWLEGRELPGVAALSDPSQGAEK